VRPPQPVLTAESLHRDAVNAIVRTPLPGSSQPVPRNNAPRAMGRRSNRRRNGTETGVDVRAARWSDDRAARSTDGPAAPAMKASPRARI